MVLQVVIAMVAGWLQQRQRQVIAYRHGENRVLKQPCSRQLTDPCDGFLLGKRHLIHDRETTYTHALDALLKESMVEPTLLPLRRPTLNAHCERFVRSIKEDALEQVLMWGDHSLSYAIQQCLAHDHHERNQQGVGNQRSAPEPECSRQGGAVVRRDRLGGLLSYDYRDAAWRSALFFNHAVKQGRRKPCLLTSFFRGAKL